MAGLCTHKSCKAPLDENGECTGVHRGLGVARNGTVCPLCGGTTHKGSVGTTAESFICAWRQWSLAENGSRETPFLAANVVAFGAWLASRPTVEYGKKAQDAKFKAMVDTGTALPPTVVARAMGGKVPPPPPAPMVAAVQETSFGATCLVHDGPMPCSVCQTILGTVASEAPSMAVGAEWGVEPETVEPESAALADLF